jgi:hypothetical protein
MAKPEKVKEDGRVWDIHGIRVTTDYIHPDYALTHQSDETMTPTGGWKLFEISHRAGLPSFRGRWDAKDLTVDIDMWVSPKELRKDFPGHRTLQQTSPGGAQYGIHIRTAESGDEVFRGSISFYKNHRLQFNATMNSFAAIQTTVKSKVSFGTRAWRAFFDFSRRIFDRVYVWLHDIPANAR